MEEALMVEQVSFSKKKTILRHPFPRTHAKHLSGLTLEWR